MNLDDLKIGEARKLVSIFSGKQNEHPYKVGEKYLIRTVTMIYTGRLVSVYDQELVIEDAAWIAETKRWHDTLKNGYLSEVEPYLEGSVIIGRGSILDVSVWKHDLPRTQK